MKTETKPILFPDDFCEIGPIKVGTVFRDWFEDGIHIMIMRGPFHPCVYFGIPKNHPLAGRDYDDLPCDVHGGFTYSGEGFKGVPEALWWYGFDYGHCDDWMFSEAPQIQTLYKNINGKKWTLKEIVDDSWNGLYQFKKLMKLAESIAGKR